MHGPEVLVPLFVMVFLFGAPVAALVISRVLAHRERMEMIRQGMAPIGAGGKRWQRAGQAFRDRVEGVGGARQEVPFVTPIDGKSPDRMLRGGVVTACIGLAVLIGLSFIGFSQSGPFGGWTIVPGPWLIGGLVPMFVGIAQIINAVLAGANIGAPRISRDSYRMPPPDAASYAEPPPWATDPMAQPGRMSEPPRIARPVPPPDIRL